MNKIFILFLLLALFAFSCGKTSPDKPDESTANIILNKAAAIFTEDMEWYQNGISYKYYNYQASFNTADYTLKLEFENDPAKSSAILNILSYCDSAAMVEAKWIRDEGQPYWQTALLRKENDNWINQFEDGYISGQFQNEIDLDNNGVNELIFKSGTSFGLIYKDKKGTYNSSSSFGYFGISGASEDGSSYESKVEAQLSFHPVQGRKLIILNYTKTENNIKTEWTELQLFDGEKLQESKVESGINSLFLTITGKDIWVRDTSSIFNSNVVMKLNSPDTCLIEGSGVFEMINGKQDVWYKINHNNKTGWVFGSQTSNKIVFKKIELDSLNPEFNSSNATVEYDEENKTWCRDGISYSWEQDEGDPYGVDAKITFQNENMAVISFIGAQAWGSMNSHSYSCIAQTNNGNWEIPQNENQIKGWLLFTADLSSGEKVFIFKEKNTGGGIWIYGQFHIYLLNSNSDFVYRGSIEKFENESEDSRNNEFVELKTDNNIQLVFSKGLNSESAKWLATYQWNDSKNAFEKIN